MAEGQIVQIIGPTVDLKISGKRIAAASQCRKNYLSGKKHRFDSGGRPGNRKQYGPLHRPGFTEGLVRVMLARIPARPLWYRSAKQTLGRIFNLLGQPIDEKGEWLNQKKEILSIAHRQIFRNSCRLRKYWKPA